MVVPSWTWFSSVICLALTLFGKTNTNYVKFKNKINLKKKEKKRKLQPIFLNCEISHKNQNFVFLSKNQLWQSWLHMWLSRAEKLLALQTGHAHSTASQPPYCLAHNTNPFILIAPWSFVQLSFGPHPETGSTSGSSSLVSESAGGLVKHGLLSPKPTASDAPGGSEAWEPAFLMSSQALLLLMTWGSHMGYDLPSPTSWFSSKSRVWPLTQVSFSGSSPDSTAPCDASAGRVHLRPSCSLFPPQPFLRLNIGAHFISSLSFLNNSHPLSSAPMPAEFNYLSQPWSEFDCWKLWCSEASANEERLLAEKRGHSGALCLKAAIHGVAWSRVSFLVPFLKMSVAFHK